LFAVESFYGERENLFQIFSFVEGFWKERGDIGLKIYIVSFIFKVYSEKELDAVGRGDAKQLIFCTSDRSDQYSKARSTRKSCQVFRP
jgi:hypothetical protein